MMSFRHAAAWLVATLHTGSAAGAELAGDAPYVPSPESVVADMLELAEVGPNDYVIDLGSGDGRIVLTAAKVFGARGLGVEIREDLVALANAAAAAEGIDDRVRFVQQDLFGTDISRATVVTMYLLPDMVNRLRDKLLWELDVGARVLSHDYPIDGWSAERVVRRELKEKVDVTGVARTNIYLYRVPADVGGRWRASVPETLSAEPILLEFTQFLTAVQGRAQVGDRRLPLDDVEIKGRQVSFTLPAQDARFIGRVENGALEGSVIIGGGEEPWRATRDDSERQGR